MIRSYSRRGLGWKTIVIPSACLLVAIIVAAILTPRITKPRGDSRLVESMAAVRRIVQPALERQSAAGGKSMVISLNELVADGLITDDMLASPFGPVSDDRGDYWSYPDPIDQESIADPSILLILYDRAMYESHDYVAVAFLDGHLTVVSPGEFDQLITQPPNGGVDYDLPVRGP